MKPLLLVLAIVFAFAQPKLFKATEKQKAALKTQADACAAAMMKQNYKAMAYYTYPPIVKMAGGSDGMEKQITAMMAQMQSQGMVFKSVTIGDVQNIVKSQNDLYCLVQDIIQVSNNDAIVTGSTYLLAYSHDNGLRWYFTDITPFKNQQPKKLFPTYPEGLIIPQTHSQVM